MVNFSLIRRKTGAIILCALFLFLPFSSWLVSISGQPNLSLIRDGLILLLFLLSLVKSWDKQSFKRLIFPAAFILFGLLTYFWREASALQWLRGWRFLFGPILLYFALLNFNFTKSDKKLIYNFLFVGAVIIIAIAILEFFHIRIPITSKYSDDGSLNEVHYVGTLAIARLSSILAGPNALGLYLVAIFVFFIGIFKKITPKLVYVWPLVVLLILLTYSRSSLLGLLAVVLVMLAYFVAQKTDFKIAISVIVLVMSLLFLTYSVLYSKSSTQEFLTHNDSSEIRLREYTRIWQTKNEIGLWGRGVGTAGPSSQNRLDNGPNHYTENIYLDIFEELGYVGLALYLTLLISVLTNILKHTGSTENYTAFLLFIGFAFAGLFINYYTGQVGIFLFWLINGLVLKDREKLGEHA